METRWVADLGPAIMDLMAATTDDRRASRPVLLCFDGSGDAEKAIVTAGDVLRPGARAVVLTVWEPWRGWEPYDPASALSAPLSKLAARTLELDEIVAEVAAGTAERGVPLAAAAGFDAQGRIEQGKPWRTICDVAEEIDASTIVLGARGLTRVASMLLGSVSSAVSVHAKRPVLIVPGRDE